MNNLIDITKSPLRNFNPLLDTDSYKFSHYLQYPQGTTSMYSYLESRGGKYSNTVFFGAQYLLYEYLQQKITLEMIQEAKEFTKEHGCPFNEEGWLHIVNKLGGYLPIRIKAVDEGAVIPTHNILMSAESTDATAFWAVSYFETMLMRMWYPITVATQSYTIKQIIKDFHRETTGLSNDDLINNLKFALHDFGARGVSSRESAGIGGMAHLINFQGSDTVMGTKFANFYYNKNKMSSFSIPAAEHSTITSWGRENEALAYKNMLDCYGKNGGIVAVVSDSYDIYNAIDKIWGEQLKQQILDNDTKLVIRPDSGTPHEVVLRCLQLLEERFGISYNAKGYKVINQVKVIQGDGICEDSIRKILQVAKDNGYAANNVNFGMGGALLQKVDRDTQKFAYKCSSITANGKMIDVYKDPITDNGKRSKKGKLDLIKDAHGNYKTIQDGTEWHKSEMSTIFENGEIKKYHSLEEIRDRLK